MSHVVITGGNKGIGLYLIQHYLAAGWQVSVLARRISPDLERMLNESEGRLQLWIADVTDPAAVATAAKQVSGPVDTLIHNAGVLIREPGDLQSLDPQAVRDTLETNLLGPIHVTQALAGGLNASSAPKVFFISSLMGSIADDSSGGYYAYRISKTALNMLARNLSIEKQAGSRPWTVVTMHPGWVRTEMGGSAAPLEPLEAARRLHEFFLKAESSHSGRFFDLNGRELPW